MVSEAILRARNPWGRAAKAAARTLVVVLFVICVGLASGCAVRTAEAEPDWGGVKIAELQQLLDSRVKALREDDERAFLASLDETQPRLIKRQRRLFRNLRQLPWEEFSYRVLPAQWPELLRHPSWPRQTILPRIELRTKLRGVDRLASTVVTGFGVARKQGRLTIISDRTGAGSFFPGQQPTPWELTRIFAERAGGAILLFDHHTREQAAVVRQAVARGTVHIQEAIPFEWDGQVLIYVMKNQEVLDTLQDVPGGDIEHLGAMTFPVRVAAGSPTIASTRFALFPSSLAANNDFLERLIRHELAHVAVGQLDNRAPTWLAEGIAEYLAERPIAPAARRISAKAMQRAAQGVTRLPPSAGFNGEEQEWNYALSWMACDYIAVTYGEPVLWQLLFAFNVLQGTGEAHQDEVLASVLGLTNFELANHALEHMNVLYR